MAVHEELSEARARLELEVINAELKKIQHGRDLTSLIETGEVLGRRDGYLFDDDRFGRDPRVFGGWVSRLEDREDGRNDPIFHDETELDEIRGSGRMLAQQNEAGVGSLRVLTNFTIGTGYTYKVRPRKDSGRASDLADAVQEWLDEFDDRTRWRRTEREFFTRSIEDGENFLEIEHVGAGLAETTFNEPDAITEPNDLRGMDDYLGYAQLSWSFGIASPLGRPDRPIGYFVDLTGDQRDWDYVPKERMVHCKRNVVGKVKRGVSDFYCPAESLRRVDKILRNTGEGAALQSAIAWVREHPPGTTATQVLNMTSGKTELSVDRTTAAGNTRTHNFQRYLPGTILDVRAGQIYKPGPMGDGAVFVDVSGAILDYVGLRWNMPQYMLSTGKTDVNFATALVTESPFVKSIESEQQWYIEDFREVKWKVLGIAIRAGRFQRYGVETVEDMRRRIKIEVQPPRVSVRNRLEETKINDVLSQRGLLSDQTWSAKEDLNFEHEQEQREKHPPLMMQSPMGSAGLANEARNREFQPQANEPGNVGSMPELGQKSSTK